MNIYGKIGRVGETIVNKRVKEVSEKKKKNEIIAPTCLDHATFGL